MFQNHSNRLFSLAIGGFPRLCQVDDSPCFSLQTPELFHTLIECKTVLLELGSFFVGDGQKSPWNPPVGMVSMSCFSVCSMALTFNFRSLSSLLLLL